MTAIFANLKELFTPQESVRKVNFDDAGFTILGGRESVRGSWSSVIEVFAYKDDRFTIDDICIGFRFDAAGAFWWISEDYVGYRAVLEELPQRFSGIRTDWFLEVAHPAFAANRTTLWGETWHALKK